VYVFAVAENNTDGGVVVFTAFEVVKYAYIHIHLADVLMGEFAGFEVLVPTLLRGNAYAHLSCDKGEASARFQQEALAGI